jgi:hypothetical protein
VLHVSFHIAASILLLVARVPAANHTLNLLLAHWRTGLKQVSVQLKLILCRVLLKAKGKLHAPPASRI